MTELDDMAAAARQVAPRRAARPVHPVAFGLMASLGAAPVLFLTLLAAFYVQTEIVKWQVRSTFDEAMKEPGKIQRQFQEGAVKKTQAD